MLLLSLGLLVLQLFAMLLVLFRVRVHQVRTLDGLHAGAVSTTLVQLLGGRLRGAEAYFADAHLTMSRRETWRATSTGTSFSLIALIKCSAAVVDSRRELGRSLLLDLRHLLFLVLVVQIQFTREAEIGEFAIQLGNLTVVEAEGPALSEAPKYLQLFDEVRVGTAGGANGSGTLRKLLERQ